MSVQWFILALVLFFTSFNVIFSVWFHNVPISSPLQGFSTGCACPREITEKSLNSSSPPPLDSPFDPSPDLPYTLSPVPGWRWYRPLNNLVTAWERGRIDWHYLVPKNTRPACGEYNLEQIIKKESRLYELLLSSRDELSYGPIDNPVYNPDTQFCADLHDKCVPHRNLSECEQDGFCFWCSSLDLCVSRIPQQPDGFSGNTLNYSLCPESPPPLQINGSIGGIWNTMIELRTPSSAECRVYITGTTYFVQPHDAARMYHHMVAELLLYVPRIEGSYNHFIVNNNAGISAKIFEWFHILGTPCWLPEQYIPQGTCFENVGTITPGEQNWFPWREYVFSRLNLTDYPKQTPIERRKPVLGVVQRIDKRAILNEPELLRKGKELGFIIRKFQFEKMSIHDQVAAARDTDIFFGIHGSGLANSLYLRPHGVLIELQPFAFERHVFRNSSRVYTPPDVKYIEYISPIYENSVIHWHFLHGPGETKLCTREDLLTRGADALSALDSTVILTQSDTIFNATVFGELLQQGIASFNETITPRIRT